MKTIFISNIGNSDLGINGESIFDPKKENVYERSKKLYESKEIDNLELLLLDPLIEKIRCRYDIERMCLFCTEQQPQHRQDTLYIGYIIKEILINDYGFSDDEIDIRRITKNPSNYDVMFDFYERELENINTFNSEIVFISPTGGTQAQNMAAIFAAVSNFRKKARMIYLPRGSREVEELQIGSRIYDKLFRERLDILRENYLYGLAADLAEEHDLLKPNEIRLLRAKNYRLLFDFENAKKILTDIRSKLTDRREEIEDAENDLERLKNRDIKALIKELYENMEIKWKQGAYVDFLGRLFRFEEACYYYLISKNFGIDISNRQNHKEFIDVIKKDNELMRFLKSKRYGGNELKIDETNVKRPLLFFILSYHKEKWGVGLLYRVFNKINDYEGNPDLSLGNLRNKTIIAHGFEGVSKEKIMELYKGDILDDLHDVCRMISKF